MGRTQELFEQGLEFVKRGGTIDMTAGLTREEIEETADQILDVYKRQAVICVTFFQVTSAKASDKLVIRLAHNQAAGSEIADSIALISDIAAEDASMNMEVQIYPSGVLGTEKDIIEMVKAGILDMAKVSSNTLGG